MNWSSDISKAPHGRYDVVARNIRGGGTADHRVFRPAYVWLASRCGKVTMSSYLPDQKRWEMFSRGEQPVAWCVIDPGDTYETTDPTSGKRVMKHRVPEHPDMMEAA